MFLYLKIIFPVSGSRVSMVIRIICYICVILGISFNTLYYYGIFDK